MAQRREQMLRLFPETHTESGQIDFDRLRLLLGDAVEAGRERYGLQWPGKSGCFAALQATTLATLRPCPQDSIRFDSSDNVVIEGDNLEVLKLLQKPYGGKVKMIYIDPPYNTGHDFIYPDNYSDSLRTYLELTGQVDGQGRKLNTNAETDGRYHSRWLTMMYPRLHLARQLLREDGCIFISIDDVECRNLRAMCDEIFGEENFVCQFVWKSKSGGANDSKHVACDHEYVVTYARNAEVLTFYADRSASVTTRYNLRDEKGPYTLDRLDKQSLGYVSQLDFPIHGPDGKVYRVHHKNPAQKVARWRWSRQTVAARSEELVFKDGHVYTKNYQKSGAIPRSLLTEERFGRTRTGKTELASLLGSQVFDNPKPSRLIKHLLAIATQSGDIVLDFFAGSGTSGQAVLQLNQQDGQHRSFILVQLPQPTPLPGYPTIAEILKERLRKVVVEPAGFRVFQLAASNFKRWTAEPPLASQLLAHVDSVVEGRTDCDLLFEIVLNSGFPLSARPQRQQLADTTVYTIDEGRLVICLQTITLEAVRELAAMQPQRIVCLDRAFGGNDELRLNAARLWRSAAVTSVQVV